MSFLLFVTSTDVSDTHRCRRRWRYRGRGTQSVDAHEILADPARQSLQNICYIDILALNDGLLNAACVSN